MKKKNKGYERIKERNKVYARIKEKNLNEI